MCAEGYLRIWRSNHRQAPPRSKGGWERNHCTCFFFPSARFQTAATVSPSTLTCVQLTHTNTHSLAHLHTNRVFASTTARRVVWLGCQHSCFGKSRSADVGPVSYDRDMCVFEVCVHADTEQEECHIGNIALSRFPKWCYQSAHFWVLDTGACF